MTWRNDLGILTPFVPLPLDKGKGEGKERGASALLGLPAFVTMSLELEFLYLT